MLDTSEKFETSWFWDIVKVGGCYLAPMPNVNILKSQNWIAGKPPFEHLPNRESASPASKLSSVLPGTAGPRNHGCLSLSCTWRSSWVSVCSFTPFFPLLFCISLMRDNSDCRSNGCHSQKTSWHKNIKNYIHDPLKCLIGVFCSLEMVVEKRIFNGKFQDLRTGFQNKSFLRNGHSQKCTLRKLSSIYLISD